MQFPVQAQEELRRIIHKHHCSEDRNIPVTSNVGSAGHGPIESTPPRPVELSLQDRLGVIGRQLDRQTCSNAAIMEVAGGFLVKVRSVGHPAPSVIEFKDEEFPARVRESIPRRGEHHQPGAHSDLLPTGYEDFLRALGYELDRMAAENVVVTEFVSLLTVTGISPTIEHGLTKHRTFAYALNSPGVQRLLAAAAARRTT